MSNKQASSLLLLPVELILHILHHLKKDPALISMFSRTCRRLHTISVPVLRRDIILRNGQELLYQRALGDFPYLAEPVRSLTLHFHYDLETTTQNGNYYPLVGEFAPTIGCLNGLQKLSIKGWGYDQPGEMHRRCNDLLQKLFVQAAKGKVLRNLHTLELNLADSSTWSWRMDDFMYLPQLKRLSILGLRIPVFGQRRKWIRKMPLEELELLCCGVSAKVLGRILSIPKALRKFVFKSLTKDKQPEHIEINPQAYFNAIARHAASLHTLDIDFWNTNTYLGGPVDLRALTELQDLFITPRTLYGNEAIHLPLAEPTLPSSLRNITFWWSEWPLSYAIRLNCRNDLTAWIQTGYLKHHTTLTWVSDVSPDDEDEPLSKTVKIYFQPFEDQHLFPANCWCCRYNLTGGRMNFLDGL